MAKQTKGASRNSSVRRPSSKTQPQQQMQEDFQMMNSMMEKLSIDQFLDIYYVEKAQIKALGKMAKKVTTEELRDILVEHQDVSQEHLIRLEQAFEILGIRAHAKI